MGDGYNADAKDAEAEIAALRSSRDMLAQLLSKIVSADGENGVNLMDAIDNDGIAYQSQWLADLIAVSRTTLDNIGAGIKTEADRG